MRQSRQIHSINFVHLRDALFVDSATNDYLSMFYDPNKLQFALLALSSNPFSLFQSKRFPAFVADDMTTMRTTVVAAATAAAVSATH